MSRGCFAKARGLVRETLVSVSASLGMAKAFVGIGTPRDPRCHQLAEGRILTLFARIYLSFGAFWSVGTHPSNLFIRE